MRRAGATFICCAIFLLGMPATSHALFWRWLDELSGPGPFNGVDVEARLHCFADKLKDRRAPSEDGPSAVSTYGRVIGAGGILPCFGASTKGPRKASINLAFSYNWAKNSNLDYDDGRDHKVHYYEIRPSAWVRAARSVDVGAGMSVMRFRGDRFKSFTRVAIQPVMVDIKPFALLNDVRHGRGYGRTPKPTPSPASPDGAPPTAGAPADPSTRSAAERQKPPDSEADLFLTVRVGLVLIPQGFSGADFGAPNDSFKVNHEALTTVSVLLDFDWLWRKYKMKGRSSPAARGRQAPGLGLQAPAGTF